MIRVVVFDLDDTLYNEKDYVLSGFRAVARFLNTNLNLCPEQLYRKMLIELQLGRGKIFDHVLGQHGIFSKKAVKKCVTVYRQHKPTIKLYKGAHKCFKEFKSYPICIVTDGHKIVQRNKIEALGVGDRVKKIFITRYYGVKNEKPSPHCFLKICSLERVTPGQVVFIADNPYKDFIGIKPLGFKTIRIRCGNYAHITLDRAHEADVEARTFPELIEILHGKLQ